MKKSGIYMYFNRRTGVIHVGQSKDLDNQRKRHLSEAKRNPQLSDLHYDLKKYGLNNFIFRILEECPVEDLTDRELYWLLYYEEHKEDPDLMRYLKVRRSSQNKPRRFRNLNTGQTFESMAAAAKWCYCNINLFEEHMGSDMIAGRVPTTGEKARWVELPS